MVERVSKKIFRSSILLTLLAMLASNLLILAILYSYFEGQLKQELKNEIDYVETAIEAMGGEYLQYFQGEAGDARRVTLISEDGKVISDTSVNADVLENHLDREEIRQAVENGEGTSIRYSETLMEKEVYYAKKLPDGRILRISTRQYTVLRIIYGLIFPFLFIFVLILFLAMAIAVRVSKSIVRPINEIDLEHLGDEAAYEEIAPLLDRISSQQKTIKHQLRMARKQQEEFRLITENMSEGLLVMDKNMRVLTYNPSALKLLEIREPDGNHILDFDCPQTFRSAVERALNGERVENSICIEEKYYSLLVNPVYEDSEVIGTVMVIVDITESALREQMRREFTSNVSHELKTPLTSISGFAEMMMEGGISEETVMDFSKSIYEEAQRLISLVLDILRISEFDENNAVFEKEEIDLFELAGEIVRRMHPEAEKKDVSLHVSGESLKILGVKKVLDEMISNLCDNAIKYNKIGGSVDVTLYQEEDFNVIEVRDTGIGIPKAHQERIFERFYRVDKARSKAIGGTGLGLSIVKHGAKLHDAQLEVQSEICSGTTIRIKFPLPTPLEA